MLLFCYVILKSKQFRIIPIHSFKILPEYFRAIETGEKTFEVRFNGRDFANGDILCLREHDVNGNSCRALTTEVT